MLLSGHHEKIRAWRRAEAERMTRERRPDLWARYSARTALAGVRAGGETVRIECKEKRP